MVLGNDIKLGAFLLTPFLFVACHIDTENVTIVPSLSQEHIQTEEPSTTRAMAGASRASSGRSVRVPEYRVGKHKINLLTEEDSCLLIHSADGENFEKLKLDLRSPCYLLTWQRLPPVTHGQGPSDGVAVGGVGDPLAWQYQSAKGAITLAVIGDPVPEKIRSGKAYESRLKQGYRCASSMQGVLLRGDKARLSKKREHVGVFCVESGVDEKDFWLLSHE